MVMRRDSLTDCVAAGKIDLFFRVDADVLASATAACLMTIFQFRHTAFLCNTSRVHKCLHAFHSVSA